MFKLTLTKGRKHWLFTVWIAIASAHSALSLKNQNVLESAFMFILLLLSWYDGITDRPYN